MYSTASADWVKGGSYSSAEIQPIYSAAPADWAKGESYSSAEIHPMYSTAPANWAKGSPTPLQRYRRCILQPQLTGPRGVLLLCRNIADVFYSLSRLGQGGVLLLCRDTADVFNSLSRLGQGGVLLLCRDTADVFYSLSRLGQGGGSYSSAEIQPMYSAAPADWAKGSPTSLQRYSRYILQPQPIGPRGVLPLCKDIADVFYSLSRLGQGGVLLLCRDTADVFYSPS